MQIRSLVKRVLNGMLGIFGLRIDVTKYEHARIAALTRYLDLVGPRPIFPETWNLSESSVSKVTDWLRSYANELDTLHERANVPEDNDYFGFLDSAVLYCMIRELAPAKIVEIGSGNSTRVHRQAILDGSLKSTLVCVDPQPRTSIQEVCDHLIQQKAETVDWDSPLLRFSPGDFLFIDSSHEVSTGTDVVGLVSMRIPRLPVGVIVHIHDIFLPYEYPRSWMLEERVQWTEQYLVHALLGNQNRYRVWWPGYKLCRERETEIAEQIGRDVAPAQSLWFEVVDL